MFCRSDKQRYALADWVKTMSLQPGVRAADRSLLFFAMRARWHCQSREAYGPDRLHAQIVDAGRKRRIFDDIHETFDGFGVAIRFAGAFSLRPSLTEMSHARCCRIRFTCSTY
jgi:hypothetical protein